MKIEEIQLRLKKHIPEYVIAELPMVFKKFEINTPLRMAHFLSQCSHESRNFTVKTENLNYSAKRLREVFGKYFKTDAMAIEYQRSPTKIANLVYGNRMGNGSPSTGDGYKYRGRGYIQLTGKNMYQMFGRYISVDLVKNPELVGTNYPLTSAAWFFMVKNINKIADEGSTEQVITSITLKVNGGKNGLVDRIEKFKFFYSLLSK